MRSVSTRTAGLLVLVAGIWGGLIPFVGPYFDFVLGPDKHWHYTSGRLTLSILPAIAVVVGGLLLLGAGPRVIGRFGAFVALVGGIWFAIGTDMSHIWEVGGAQGPAHGTRVVQTLEHLSFSTALGALIIALAAYSLPRGLAREGVARERTGRDRTGRDRTARHSTDFTVPAGQPAARRRGLRGRRTA
ncbi:MAG: hypothetical protein M3Y17_02900 [Actinomycetota bacterium]|nr:hypothetical protein [Actinomycetota bacterium]